MNGRRFFCFRPFWKDRAQDTKKVNKMHPKARQVRSKFAFLGTAHLGTKLANMAPSWLQLGPSWRQDAPQQASKWSPRCVPNRILGHLGAKRVAHELKSAPGVSIFTDFPPILDRIQLLFEATSFNFQPRARHGGGLARAAHWIIYLQYYILHII